MSILYNFWRIDWNWLCLGMFQASKPGSQGLLLHVLVSCRNKGSYVSGDLPTYPSPKPTFCPSEKWVVSQKQVGGEPGNEVTKVMCSNQCKVWRWQDVFTLREEQACLIATGDSSCRIDFNTGTKSSSARGTVTIMIRRRIKIRKVLMFIM